MSDSSTRQQATLDNAFSAAGIAPTRSRKKKEVQPAYKMIGTNKVPVSKQRGQLWKSRVKRAEKMLKDLFDAWQEAIDYYNNDQSEHRSNSDPAQANNTMYAGKFSRRHSSTENIVFANMNALIPILYAKNPYVGFSSQANGDAEAREQFDDRARSIEKLVNALFDMKAAPGVNLKPLAKRCVLVTLLTNISWIEAGYTLKQDSLEQSLIDLQNATKKLQDAKNQEDIIEAEGELAAIEETIDYRTPAGPFLKFRSGKQIIVDPNCTDIGSLKDANWVAVHDMLPTSYVKAVFMKMSGDEENEEYTSIYEPTHVLSCEDSEESEDDRATELFDNKKTYASYGFGDEESFKRSQMTEVYYIWDKTTRRIELYHAKSWKWPIWVWEDRYQLINFFPFRALTFHDNPEDLYAKGEVSFYLDQQDEINTINSELNMSRNWARRHIFFNSNAGISKETIEKVVFGPSNGVVGVDLPEGVDISKVIFSVTPPSANFVQLFDKRPLYESIDRIAASNEALRGGQFKTNTTNQAIEYYSTMGNQRMDMRLDAIEDFIADIGWMVAQLCLRFMSPEVVKQITNLDVAATWAPIDPTTDFGMSSMTAVGGSSQKQNKQTRKREALEVGQILSQFVKAAPASIIDITLRMFSEAFDDIIIKEEDWDKIREEALMVVQAGQGGAPGQQPRGEAGGPPQAGGGGNDPRQVAMMVVQALKQLPPDALKAIGLALAQGVPPEQIAQQVLGGGGQQPQQQPNGA